MKELFPWYDEYNYRLSQSKSKSKNQSKSKSKSKKRILIRKRKTRTNSNKSKSKTNSDSESETDTDYSESENEDDNESDNNENDNSNSNGNNDRNKKVDENGVSMDDYTDDGGKHTNQSFVSIGLWAVGDEKGVVWRYGVNSFYDKYLPCTNPCTLDKDVGFEYYDDGSVLALYDNDDKRHYQCKKCIGNGASMFMQLTVGHLRWKTLQRMKWMDVNSVNFKQFLWRCQRKYTSKWYASKLTDKQKTELKTMKGGYKENFNTYVEKMEQLRGCLLWNLEHCCDFMTAIWTQYNTPKFKHLQWQCIPPMPTMPVEILKKKIWIDVVNENNEVESKTAKFIDDSLLPGVTQVPFEFIQVCGQIVVSKAEHPRLYKRAMALAMELRQHKYVLLSSIVLLSKSLLCVVLLSVTHRYNFDQHGKPIKIYDPTVLFDVKWHGEADSDENDNNENQTKIKVEIKQETNPIKTESNLRYNENSNSNNNNNNENNNNNNKMKIKQEKKENQNNSDIKVKREITQAFNGVRFDLTGVPDSDENDNDNENDNNEDSNDSDVIFVAALSHNDNRNNSNDNDNNNQIKLESSNHQSNQPFRPQGSTKQSTLTQHGFKNSKPKTSSPSKKQKSKARNKIRSNKIRSNNNSNSNSNNNDSNSKNTPTIGKCGWCGNKPEKLDQKGYCQLCSKEELVSIYENNKTPEQIEELNKEKCCVCKQKVCKNKSGTFDRCSHGSNKLEQQVRCPQCRHDPKCAHSAKFCHYLLRCYLFCCYPFYFCYYLLCYFVLWLVIG